MWLRRVWRRFRPPRRLKLTREGRYFIAITIGIGLAAVNTGNNLLYLLLGWLLSMIVASGALSDISMRGLKVSRRPPGRLHANRPFLMEIAVENTKKSLASFSVEIEDLVENRPLDKKCYFLKVPAGRIQRTSYRHTFTRRGLYTFDGFRISTKFPFSLFHKSRVIDMPGELLVYPAVETIPPPPPRARLQGETAAKRSGRRGEFFGLREYREGDDRRAIHWRSSARAARLLVREYEEESHRRVTLMVDNALPAEAEPEAHNALEAAISLAASLAQSYVRVGYAVRLVSRGLAIPFGVGEAQLMRVLKALALLETVDDQVRFAGAAEPHGENLLVVPRGVAVGHRPGGVTQVLEAG